MSERHCAYVTYFDQRYLAFAIVMLRSLRRHDPEPEVFALCFDRTSYETIVALDDRKIVAVAHDSILAFDPALKGGNVERDISYYAKHKPVLPLYVFSRRPELYSVAHVDADCCFFSSPKPLFDEIGDASVAVSPHQFSSDYQDKIVYGRFNAGFIYWRNDDLGRRCLVEYRADCLRWCELSVEPDGRYANQGYLTAWPQRYTGVHVIRCPGVNLSWWNVRTYPLARAHGGTVTVGGVPLIFHHFSHTVLDANGIWHTYRKRKDANWQIASKAIYRPYLKQLERTDRSLRRRMPDLPPMGLTWVAPGKLPIRQGPWPRHWRGKWARAKWLLSGAGGGA